MKLLSKVRPLMEETAREGRTLLDAACGNGIKTAQLHRLGFRVTATSFGSERPSSLPQEVRFLPGVDLNQGLPFRDGSFDYLYLSEVIEHLESLPHIVREAARIVRPGGAWLITCPNTATAFGRFYYAATGLLPGMKYPVPLTIPPLPGDNVYMPHLWQLHYLFHHHGFRIESLHWDLLCSRSLVLLPLLLPLLALGMPYAYGRIRDRDLLVGRIDRSELPVARRNQRLSNNRLARLYLSGPALLSKSLILMARRVE